MELNKSQFDGYQPNEEHKVKPLNKNVGRLYPQLAEQLNLFIKQARLAKLKKELGES